MTKTWQIPEGKVKSVSVGGVVVWQAKEDTPEETYTVSGTWYFNEDVITGIDSLPNEEVKFTSNGNLYTLIEGVNISSGLRYDSTTVYGNTGWVNEAYRTITFDDTQTVSKEFYEWLTGNAAQKLASPRISIPEENILLIEQGDGNASTYSIRIDGTQKDTQNAPNDSTPLSYNLSKLGLSAGNYTATVVATAEGYIDSDSSNEQPIKVVESGKTHVGGSN